MTVHTFARTLPFATSVSVDSPIRVHRRAMVIVDFLVVLLAIMTTLVLGWGAGATLTEDWPRIALSLSLLLIWPLMMWTRQTTAVNLLGQGAEEYRRVLVASAWTLLMVAAVSYFIGTERGRWFLLGAMVLGTMGLLVGRHVMRVALRALMAKGTPLHRVFVIAAPSRAQEIFANFEGKDTRYQQAGVWHLKGGQGDPDPTQIVSRALEVGADTILFAPLGTENTQWTRRLSWATENLDVALLVSPSLAEIAGPRLSVEPLEGMTFVRVGMPQFTGPARVAKRALDIFGASVGLVVLSPLMLLIGVLIRRDSAGPAIFKQVRAGIGDSTFECWKFRTMYIGADAERAALRKAHLESSTSEVNSLRDGQPATFKMASDPRITRIGGWLRKYSIDEIPQLMNVLRGEMSLVGPRPHPLDDVELYDEAATRRLLAKPGMTGLWQVSGRSDLEWEKAVRLDLFYVENWSLAIDFVILMRTVKVVLTGSGAY